MARTIESIENGLTMALDPSAALTPAGLTDVMEMFTTLLHLRKVTIDYWIEVAPKAVRGIALAQRIQAEANLSNVEGLTEAQVKILATSIELSIKEIKALRGELLERLNVLKQMAPPDEKIH